MLNHYVVHLKLICYMSINTSVKQMSLLDFICKVIKVSTLLLLIVQ